MIYGLSLPNVVVILISVTWLVFRANKVLTTPVSSLVGLLGLDVPSPPVVSLLDVTADGLSVHWKPPEHRNSVVKHLIKINGYPVGDVPVQDNSISISGLLPGRFYIVRVVALNSAHFQASSDAVRIRTPGDGPVSNIDRHGGDTAEKVKEDKIEHDRAYAPSPVITVHRHTPDATNRLAPAPAMTRDQSSGSQNRRAAGPSRTSPTANTTEQRTSADEIGPAVAETAGIIKGLSDKLDSLRREIEDVEKQEREEEEEHQITRDGLNERREHLRQQLKEREDESKDLKKNIISLERANTAAQSKKITQERQLAQKRNEREKLHQDITKWDDGVIEMQQEEKQLALQKSEYEEASRHRIEEMKREHETDLQKLKKVEDLIHERGTHVKSLEEEQKKLLDEQHGDGTSGVQPNEVQEQFEWQQRMSLLENHAHRLWSSLRDAQLSYHYAQQRFQAVNARRGSQHSGFVPYHQEGFPQNPDMSAIKPNMDTMGDLRFAQQQAMVNSRNGTNSAAGFRTGSPVVPMSGTIPMPERVQNKDSASPVDIQKLTGGALTSPTADLLLPSGLLGDDPEDLAKRSFSNFPVKTDEETGSRPSSTTPGLMRGLNNRSTSGGSDYIPGLGAIPGLGSTDAVYAQGLGSPASIGNGSLSAISSPRGSIANLAYNKYSDGQMDSDRRSIRSASGSSRAMTGSRRFGELFNRQRGKTMSNEEGPILGSLKSSQSQSMPRQLENEGENPTKKATGSQGFFGQMSSAVLGRRNPPPSKPLAETDAAEEELRPSKSNPFNVFGTWSRNAANQRPLSARPASTYSAELPQPSSDVPHFGWSITDNSSRSNSIRSSAIGNPWGSHSARQSTRLDSTTDLVGGNDPLEEESQELSHDDDHQSPVQAPIGTKPKAKKAESPPTQLNPNANTFKSRFTKEKRSDKDKVEKRTSKSKRKPKSPTPAAEDASTASTDDSSPPNSRQSRDSRRAVPTTPTEELTDPEDRIDSAPATPSESGVNTTSHPSRESFMQKLTRKGSSSKFHLAGLKDRGSLFSRKSYQSEDPADDDPGTPSSAGGLTVGRGGDASVTSSPQIGTGGPSTPGDRRSGGFSLSALTKRKKSGVGNATPSISETSMASETGDEIEDGDESRLSEDVASDV